MHCFDFWKSAARFKGIVSDKSVAIVKSSDIFCSVIDNYGDIGVCWRLARQLVNEQGLQVRLWVDDLHSFGKLCAELDTSLDEQTCRGVEVRRWRQSGDVTVSGVFPHPCVVVADLSALQPRPTPSGCNPSPVGRRALLSSPFGGGIEGGGVADLVIEAFACKLPPAYIEAMAAQERKPVWINLEYLSAEDWVEGCHKLPSPHPTLPLTKYFFFPGFTEKTGGLLLEHDLLQRREVFQSDAGTQHRFWQGLGIPPRIQGELRVSLFSYENAAIPDLLRAWEHGEQRVTCLLPEGRALPQVKQYFESVGRDSSRHGDCIGMNSNLQRGNLHVYVLPFVAQENYDELLWVCDINFVRGEDSCVRAQWAGLPFIWHIYPQHDGVHLQKLEALRMLYTANLPAEAAQAVCAMWLAWNGGQGVATAWRDYAAQHKVLESHGKDWAKQLSRNSLALNLLDFSRQLE